MRISIYDHSDIADLTEILVKAGYSIKVEPVQRKADFDFESYIEYQFEIIDGEKKEWK